MIRASILSLITLAIALIGCHKQKREFVVFSDPWYGDFVRDALNAFNEVHPEVNVILHVRSSEVIAQRISLGDPIDYIFALDSTLFSKESVRSRLTKSLELAPVLMVKVRVKGPLNENIPGAGGSMLEASDRPTRRAAENWFLSDPDLRPSDSIIIANFYAQARDYLVNGWVRFGFAPDLLLRQYPDELEIVEEGPEIPGGLRTYIHKQHKEEEGSSLSEFLMTEKCRRLLVDHKIIK